MVYTVYGHQVVYVHRLGPKAYCRRRAHGASVQATTTGSGAPVEPLDAEAAAPPLGALLLEIGMRPEQLMRRINLLRRSRGDFPLSEKTAYAWLRRSRRPACPSPDNQRDALSVLSTKANRAVTADELGWSSPRKRSPHHPRQRCLDAPGDAPVDALLQEIVQGDPLMDRRNLLLLSGAAATAPGLALLIPGGTPARAAQAGGRLSDTLLTSIETTVRELRELDDADGSVTGLVWAGGLWQSVAKVVANAHYSGTPGRRLHTAFIELCEQYGWMLFDADRQPQAQRVYQTGMRLAREADPAPEPRFATSNLLASASYQASWLSQHSEAKTLLDIAARTPAGLPPRLAAVIADRAIFAAGRRGDIEALRRHRDTAHEHLDNAGNDEPWWSQWLTHHAIDAATGRAWLAARQPDTAEPYLNRRLEAVDPAYPRDRVLAILDLADTHRLRGDRATATSLTRQAGTLTAGVHSPRTRNRLSEITNALGPSLN